MELPVDDTDRALFAAATSVTVRNGNRAAFWTSSWLHGTSPATLFADLYMHSRRKNRTVNEAISGHNWIRDIAHHLTAAVLHDYFKLWEIIDSVPLDLTQHGNDEIIWTQSANGIYSAKSAYDLQFLGSQPSELPVLVWSVWAPPRVKVFMWLLLQHRIWTADRLQRRGWPNDYFCPLCVRNLETVQHLFVECAEVQELWARVATWLQQQSLKPQS